MFNTIRQGADALTVLASSRSGGTTLLFVVLLVLLISVVWAAIWSGDPQRREAALAVLDRLLRWKGR